MGVYAVEANHWDQKEPPLSDLAASSRDGHRTAFVLMVDYGLPA